MNQGKFIPPQEKVYSTTKPLFLSGQSQESRVIPFYTGHFLFPQTLTSARYQAHALTDAEIHSAVTHVYVDKALLCLEMGVHVKIGGADLTV